jgi:hypothetical protein
MTHKQSNDRFLSPSAGRLPTLLVILVTAATAQSFTKAQVADRIRKVEDFR